MGNKNQTPKQKTQNEQFQGLISKMRRKGQGDPSLNTSKEEQKAGLIVKNAIDQQSVPLIWLDYRIGIKNSLATVVLEQEYFNDSNKAVETEYFFAIAADCCFFSFSAEFRDRTVKGVIKEKFEARRMYEEEKQKGNAVAFAEINDTLKDVMKINVGNLPAQETVKITFSYLQQLDVCLSKFWLFSLPSTLTPKFVHQEVEQKLSQGQVMTRGDMQTQQDAGKICAMENISKTHKNAYQWDIKVNLESSSPITFLKSPSHADQLLIDRPNEFTAYVRFGSEDREKKAQFPTKNFTLVFRNSEINAPQCNLGVYHLQQAEEQERQHNLSKYCAMITFFPEFNNDQTPDDAYSQFQQDSNLNNIDVNLMTAKGEFVFLLDRSGSMSGGRMNMAKEALSLFLKSLPSDSYFNVCSFGTQQQLMFDESKKYSQATVDAALQEIQGYSADMGGTEIYGPLKSLFPKQQFKHYPKNIFLLTDGDVSNTEQVIALIRENNKKAKVFTIGIGSGCSEQLIKEGARAGLGKAVFIGDQDDMNAKVVTLLSDSITPFLDNFVFGYDKSLVDVMVPDPTRLAYLRANEPFSVWVFMNATLQMKQKTCFSLTCYDSVTAKEKSFSIEVHVSQAEDGNLAYHRLGAHKLVRQLLQNAVDQRSAPDYDVFIQRKQDLLQYALNVAVDYQILTELTAFLCVVQQKTVTAEQQALAKTVFIPNLVSADHEDNAGMRQEEEAEVQVLGGKSRKQVQKANKKMAMAPGSNRGGMIQQGLSRSSNSNMPSKPMAMPKGSLATSSAMKMQMQQPQQQQFQMKEKEKEFMMMQDSLDFGAKDIINNNNNNNNNQDRQRRSTGLAQDSEEDFDREEEEECNVVNEDDRVMCINPEYQQEMKEQVQQKESTVIQSMQKVAVPDSKHYLEIAKLQTAIGNWESNVVSVFVAQYAINPQEFLLSIPQILQGKPNTSDLWATILTLVYLDCVLQSSKNSWKLIYKKGNDWLKFNQITLKEYEIIAKSALHIV